MLTRLKVSGFKNLVDVDVRFGPFTCIAGGNGVGKSNLFDAIRFLSDLAHKSLIDAALSVRGEADKLADVRRLFHHANGDYTKTISFEAEMIIPTIGKNIFGQKVKADATFLRYKLVIGYRENVKQQTPNVLEIIEEELTPIMPEYVITHSGFLREGENLFNDVLVNKNELPLLLTKEEGGARVLVLPRNYSEIEGEQWLPLSDIFNTGLSISRYVLGGTGELVCQEMQSWRVYNWEPSALREPSVITKPAYLGADGSQLAAAIYRIAQNFADAPLDNNGDKREASQMYQFFANRLSALIGDVHRLRVDYEEASERYTLWITGRDGTEYNARSLSDGTLRFLAYAAFVFDDEAKGVLCFEEPENGLHPERITALLELLQHIVVDVNEPIGPDNPLRQVIITTHSPGVVQQIPADSLILAELRERPNNGKSFKYVGFSALPNTWRTAGEDDSKRFSRGVLLPYFNPSPYRWQEEKDEADETASKNGNETQPTETIRVMDRPDLQRIAPWNYCEK